MDGGWRARAGSIFTTQKAPATGSRGMAVTNHPLGSAAAAEMRCVIKLLARCAVSADGSIAVGVHPTMVPLSHPLASVAGAYNAVFVELVWADRLMFMGPGAGGRPTASAVVGDVVTAAREIAGVGLEQHRPQIALIEVGDRTDEGGVRHGVLPAEPSAA